MQLEIDCYEWVLGKIDVNKIPFDRLLNGLLEQPLKIQKIEKIRLW
jgi:hypothetical protein